MNFVPFCDPSQIATSETVNIQVPYYERVTYLVSVTEKPLLSVSNPVRVTSYWFAGLSSSTWLL